MPIPSVTVCALAGVLFSQSAAAGSDSELADFTLEELAQVTVVSVSRQPTRLADAAAAIYVIQGEDIRRAGATSLPEALRLAPNLQVARAGSHSWAITARGLSSTLENKLLVMIDGRSVYSPLFSGVFWDMQDVVMEDIERIEVISGPGATIWGANAVNGVINIITRPARATQGSYVGLTAGRDGQQGAVRHGGQGPGGADYRVYGHSTRGGAEVGGEPAWQRSQAGFRVDDDSGAGTAITVSGDAYTGTLGQRQRAATDIAGANLLARLHARLASGADLRLQAWIDHAARDEPGLGAQRLDTFDLEAQMGSALDARNQLAWGGGVRTSADRIDNRGLLFTPASRTLRWSNLFAQDELALTPALRLTGGVKFEHNSYTGLETLPSLRLAWSPSHATLAWGALSRTVRAPSRLERDLVLPGASGAAANLVDTSNAFASETARVAELGYRVQPAGPGALAWSATLFYSDYARLRTLEANTGASGGATFQNLGHASARGIELWAHWQATPAWRLDGGAVLQRLGTGVAAYSRADPASLAGADPRQYWSLLSAHAVTARVHADLALRHVGSLAQPAVAAYTELDARLAWQASHQLELALAGRNLLHAEHVEYGPSTPALRQAVARSVAASAYWRF